ncbi:alpha-1,2-fucosyltransferase [Propionivibrio dicarboxylicus]|uniref:Glycosyl transferase family 11 n=1 Tax=Propionivibrio dicarboxylicus TaxID=83767 RepID=A0A1G8DZP3_9RHOO|nr:alpha-1,2-fucosyltransferase [Propionivibrio dicarboxylicus]SDH63097.1 Glycosyl transferase family 11 [Propionivibrio dicarboxylicus]
MSEAPRSVVVGLSGGLGNQMFQYAAGRALAHRLNTRLILDLSWFSGQSERHYALTPFRIEANLQSAWPSLPTKAQSLISRLSRRWMPRIMGVPVWREPHFHYAQDFAAIQSPVFLEGFWQSERYFKDVRQQLQSEFSLRDPMPPACQAVLDKIRACDALCIHVRRGDYLSNPIAAKVHGTCSTDYYRDGVSELSRKLKTPHAFVFSDEPDWARDSLTFDCPMTVVDINTPTDAHLDLLLMSACRHFVIANSSLSWWAAWIGEDENTTVIAPTRWFLTADKDTSDLLPDHWLKR